MAEHEPESVIDAAARLNESMQDLKVEINGLRTYGQRTRKYFWGLAASVAFDVALTIVLIFVAVVASDASSQATRNRDSQVATCESGNQAREVSANLWRYVLDASSKNPQNQTPERKKQIDDFRAYMEAAYVQRDCSLIGK